jgi:hypothetical protein
MAVNLSPLAGAGWQFFDNNGVILSGGLLYTYAAGTTTPQTTYTSSSGATANSNPIVLDSAGRVTGEIWLTSSQSYKFVLNTSLGVTIGTYDNVYGVNDLSASNGSSLVGYLPATGPATTVQAELRALDAADDTFALKGANTDITSLNAPALGAATATTATAGDSSTKVATTAFVTTAVGSNIFSFPDPTLTGALTLPVSTTPVTLAFRSTTPESGLTTVVTGTPAALVVPNGATLGTTSAVQSTIVEVLINNAGTLERAVVNLAGSNILSETGLISTTAINTGSDSADVFYSTTARSNVAYRVVRSITSTQATAGTWVTTPSAVQGNGGNALIGISSAGYGQTWQTFTIGTNRLTNSSFTWASLATKYTNSTSKPITVSVGRNGQNGYSTTVWVDSVAVVNATVDQYGGAEAMGPILVPPGSQYAVSVTGGASCNYWVELR